MPEEPCKFDLEIRYGKRLEPDDSVFDHIARGWHNMVSAEDVPI